MSGNKVRAGAVTGTSPTPRGAGVTLKANPDGYSPDSATASPVVPDMTSAFSMLEDAINTNGEAVNELYRRLGIVLDFNAEDSRPSVLAAQCGASPAINRVLANEAMVRSINSSLIHILQNLTV